MGSKVLTPLQEKVLTALFDNGLADCGYYLTGGTALSEFYLQHRHSDDLDIFTRKSDPLEEELKTFSNLLTSLGFAVSLQSVDKEGMILFVHELKVEFHRDAPARMAPPYIHGQIVVDSFEDIAVNKVCAILSRSQPESKDFCDLLFILNESRYELDYLISRAREKEAAFDMEEGTLAFAVNLLAVEEFQTLPRMIRPLGLERLREYFIPIAEELIERLRPQGG